MPPLTVGLTGGIASGKSLAGHAFEALGVPLLDADQVARDVVAPGTPALAQIAQHFGTAFILADGGLDRRRLRERVFADAEALRALEAITHPHIRARMTQWRAAQVSLYCVLSVAILVEARMRDLVDRVLVIDAPVETQLARLLARDGATAELALRMIGAQASREERLAAADDVIVNQGDPDQLREAVGEVHRFYAQLAQRGEPHAPPMRLPKSMF